jgi:hypothetical protein
MRVFAKVGESFQIVEETGGEVPDGYILMSETRPDGENTLDYTAQVDGTWSVTLETRNAKLAPTENAWRDSEMPKAQQNVTAIEYGEEDIPGTTQQWQRYWLALRKWTAENPDFPDSSKRPVAPG